MDARNTARMIFCCVCVAVAFAEEKSENEVVRKTIDNNQKTYSFIIPQEDRVRLTFVDKSELGKLDDLHANLLNLYQTVLEKVLKMNELEAKVNLLFEKYEQAGDLGKQLQDLNNQFKEIRNTSMKQNIQSHDVKQDKNVHDNHLDEIEDLSQHVKRLYERVEIHKDMIRTQNEKTSQISMDLVKLQDTTESRLQAHKNTMDVLSSQIRELDSSVNLRVGERQLSESNSSQGEINKLSQQVVNLQEDVQDLLKTYQNSSPKITEIKSEIQTCSKKTSNMEEKFDSLRLGFSDLEKSFLSLPKGSSGMDSGLHERLDSLEKRLISVSSVVDKVNQTCHSAVINSTAFNKQIDDINIEVERYKKIFNKHYENLRNFQAHQKDMIARYEKNKFDRDELRDRIVSSERTLIDLKTKLESHIITCPGKRPPNEALRRDYFEVTTKSPETDQSVDVTTSGELLETSAGADVTIGGDVEEITTAPPSVQFLTTKRQRTQRNDHQVGPYMHI